MRIVGVILRVFSFLFGAVLSVFLLAVAGLSWTTPSTLHLKMLPLTGAALVHLLFWSGLVGLITALLAWRRIVPVLFVVWNAAVLLMLVKGYFFSSFSFGRGSGSLGTALCLIAGALLALVGSYRNWRPSKV